MKYATTIAVAAIIAVSLAVTYAAERSGKWETVRRKHLETQPACAVCGAKTDLEVHHVRPFHLYPELELEPENLLTLCNRGCHLLIGHLGSYQSWNPNARGDAAWWRERIKERKYERE